MADFIRCIVLYMVLLFSINCVAKNHSIRNGLVLDPRQDSGSDGSILYSCRLPCDVNICGQTCGGADKLRRDLRVSKLRKRKFYNIPQVNLTREAIAAYLPEQWHNNADGQYGPKNIFDDEEIDENGENPEDTVIYQEQFGDEGFQFMAGGLTGCTMVTVVSNRAVWIAHFWERLTNLEDDADDPLWQQEVLNVITGAGGATELSSIIVADPYYVDEELYNQPGDTPAAYIMAVLNEKARLTGPQTTLSTDPNLSLLEYPNKINAIRRTLADLIPGINIVIYGYPGWDESVPEEDAQRETNERGFALFQYDPDSDGNGNAGYRLYYEQTYVQVLIPS